MSTEPCPHAIAAVEIITFDATGAKTAQVFTNGDADFRIGGREFTIDVKRAVTPAFVERAERAAVNAYAQAGKAEAQAQRATAAASKVEEAFRPVEITKVRKATRRKR